MNKWEIALDRYISATNTHVFDEVEKCISNDAIYYFTNATCSNLESIKKYFENSWDTIKEEVYSYKDAKWKYGEDMALVLYTYQYKGYYKGEWTTGSGRATNIFKIIDNEVKLIHEHLSSNKR